MVITSGRNGIQVSLVEVYCDIITFSLFNSWVTESFDGIFVFVSFFSVEWNRQDVNQNLFIWYRSLIRLPCSFFVRQASFKLLEANKGWFHVFSQIWYGRFCYFLPCSVLHGCTVRLKIFWCVESQAPRPTTLQFEHLLAYMSQHSGTKVWFFFIFFSHSFCFC